MVTTNPQSVKIRLRLNTEAGIFGKSLASGPILQSDQQFVGALVGQPEDVLQAQPVFPIDVSKPLL